MLLGCEHQAGRVCVARPDNGDGQGRQGVTSLDEMISHTDHRGGTLPAGRSHAMASGKASVQRLPTIADRTR